MWKILAVFFQVIFDLEKNRVFFQLRLDLVSLSMLLSSHFR